MSLKTINDLTEVDESQLQDDALVEGAIPPVSGSIFAPVKVTLAKLAKWILNSYAGLSLAGSTQSAKSAVDSLSGTTTTLRADVDNITYGNGTRIPANSDLNDYTTAGAYYTATAVDAQTLSNCPTTTSFRLEVKYNANQNRMHQIMFCNSATGAIYFRTYTGDWNGWRQVTTTAVT